MWPSRIFNRCRNRRADGSKDKHKVATFIRMLVTRGKNVPKAAEAWVANEEEILSEQGSISIEKFLASTCLESLPLALTCPFVC